MPQETSVIPSIFTNEIFLRTGAGEPDWRRVKVAHFLGDPESQPRGAWQGYPAEQMLKAPHAHLNCYFSVGVQRGDRRDIAGFERIFVVVIDDIGPKIDLAAAVDLIGMPPSYILETSPGNCQAGWWCDLRDPEWAVGVMDAICRALGRPPDNLKNLVGYMRLPIGSNGKKRLGAPFRHRLLAWRPHTRIGPLDWIEIERRLGGVTPVSTPQESPPPGMPSSEEMDADAVMQAFQILGRVQGQPRRTTMGWGVDVDCPWIEEHSERAQEGATYVPSLGRFHCHHGHCQERTMDDVRSRLDELLREESGGIVSLASLAFDDVDPVRLPPSASGHDPAERITDFWDEKEPPDWPGDILPAELEDVLAAIAERDGLDHGALGAAMMTAASGAADKRARFAPYADASWRVRPVLWLMLIAETGMRKTAVLTHLLQRLRQLNLERMRAHAALMAAWRQRPTSEKQKPAPTVTALLAEDATIEKLQEWMAGNPRGMLYLRDELAALFDFGRYSPGGGTAERAFLLETNEGGPTTIGRMTRTTTIENCALSILGATQPHRLAEFKGLSDDGLLSRFATVVMQRAGGGVAPGETAAPLDLGLIDGTIDRLLRRGAFSEYRAEAEGEALIRGLEERCDGLLRRPDTGVGFRGFIRKLHGVAARAALVLHLIDDSDDVVIQANTIRRAQRYAQFLCGHAEVFYAGLPGAADGIVRAIASFLLRHPELERVTAGQLRRDVAPCRQLRSLKEIQDVVFLLMAGGWLSPVSPWPSNAAWLVRPDLKERFAERRAAETARVEAVKEAMNWLGRYR